MNQVVSIGSGLRPGRHRRVIQQLNSYANAVAWKSPTCCDHARFGDSSQAPRDLDRPGEYRLSALHPAFGSLTTLAVVLVACERLAPC